MAYQVLARKYRPLRFADVAGQDHVTITLMNALTQGRIAHGYIFSGHRGIGKTTIARILASALNCRNPIGSELRPTAEPCLVCDSCLEIRAGNAVDVIEIDAATNRGIDEIRELRDAARYRPARDKYKIYILDEAHQITDAAFNALLKTLEEPPDHIVFMMATTQPEDIPQTVRSRCQHYSFHAVKLVDILSELRGIATKEDVEADEAALNLLAEAGDGSMRDALSIMDQAIASAPLSDGRPILDASQIRELMGTVPNAVFERILQAVDSNSSADVITVANQLLDAGNSPAQLARQFVRYLRNTLIAKIANISPNAASFDGLSAELLQISPDEQRRAARSATLFSEEELTRFLQVMLRTFDELGYRQEQRFHFELGLLKLVHLRRLLPVEELLSQLPTSTKPAAPSPRATPAAASPASPARATASLTSAVGAGTEAPSAPRANASVVARPVSAPLTAPVTPSKSAFSPFDADSTRKRSETPSTPAPPPPPKPNPAPAPSASPFAATGISGGASEPLPTQEQSPGAPSMAASSPWVGSQMPTPPQQPTPTTPEAPSLAPPPNPAPTPTPADQTQSPVASSMAALSPREGSAHQPTPDNLDALKDQTPEALANTRNQTSAADALADNELRIQTELSKTILPMVINAEADKILRTTLRSLLPPGTKVTLLPGTASASTAKKPRPARSGSAQAKALEHPVVQQAQRLFDAEIRTVIDLREGN